jgi:hypothetical protein
MTPVENAPLDFDAAVREVQLDVDAIIRTGRGRRRRRRYGAAMAVVVVADTATTFAVSEFVGSGSSGEQSLNASITVPCDVPTRTVPDYLDWPCATGPVTPYFAGEIGLAVGSEGSPPQKPVQHARSRVLAFGALPNGTSGSTITVVEYWRAGGRSLAQLVALDSSTQHKQFTSFVSARVPVAGDPALFSVPAYWFPPKSVTMNPCEYFAHHPPRPPYDPTATCTRTVVARTGVAAVRLLRGPGHPDAAVPVHDGLAGIFEAPPGTPGLSEWRIQALNSEGRVISSVPYSAFL